MIRKSALYGLVFLAGWVNTGLAGTISNADCFTCHSDPGLESSSQKGLKLFLEGGSWVLFRLSGTEPVCRLYCEAPTEQELHELNEAGRQFLFG